MEPGADQGREGSSTTTRRSKLGHHPLRSEHHKLRPSLVLRCLSLGASFIIDRSPGEDDRHGAGLQATSDILGEYAHVKSLVSLFVEGYATKILRLALRKAFDNPRPSSQRRHWAYSMG
jgi:hypothetical protein